MAIQLFLLKTVHSNNYSNSYYNIAYSVIHSLEYHTVNSERFVDKQVYDNTLPTMLCDTHHISASSCWQVPIISSMLVVIPFHSITDFLARNKTGFLKRTSSDGRSGDGTLIAADVRLVIAHRASPARSYLIYPHRSQVFLVHPVQDVLKQCQPEQTS